MLSSRLNTICLYTQDRTVDMRSSRNYNTQCHDCKVRCLSSVLVRMFLLNQHSPEELISSKKMNLRNTASICSQLSRPIKFTCTISRSLNEVTVGSSESGSCRPRSVNQATKTNQSVGFCHSLLYDSAWVSRCLPINESTFWRRAPSKMPTLS